jgi:hypothetical protein
MRELITAHLEARENRPKTTKRRLARSRQHDRIFQRYIGSPGERFHIRGAACKRPQELRGHLRNFGCFALLTCAVRIKCQRGSVS